MKFISKLKEIIMLISTRGRYALRILIDLAENQDKGLVPLKEIAKRQEISLKYIEQFMPILVSNNLVSGKLGRGGGYQLTKSPEEYSIIEILELFENTIAPVECLKPGAKKCNRAEFCKSLPLWKDLYQNLIDFFNGKTLADLI